MQIVVALSLSHSLSLQALSEIESEDLVQEERARKAAVRKSKMDADLDAESADLQEKKGVSVCACYSDDHYRFFSDEIPTKLDTRITCLVV